MCVDAITRISTIWGSGKPEDKQGMAKTLFSYIAFDLDTHRITDFRMKSWADQFIVLRSALYGADDKRETPLEGVQEVYTGVAPTGLEPVSSP